MVNLIGEADERTKVRQNLKALETKYFENTNLDYDVTEQEMTDGHLLIIHCGHNKNSPIKQGLAGMITMAGCQAALSGDAQTMLSKEPRIYDATEIWHLSQQSINMPPGSVVIKFGNQRDMVRCLNAAADVVHGPKLEEPSVTLGKREIGSGEPLGNRQINT